MGFFSFYCGLIYNDFFSIPLNLFGTCYNLETGERKDTECTYPIGIDPVWYLSRQEISFLNSIKMKLGVILGVTHMSLGIVMKGLNARSRGNKLDFYFEFLPQLVMLVCMFGYMDLLIVIKWL